MVLHRPVETAPVFYDPPPQIVEATCIQPSWTSDPTAARLLFERGSSAQKRRSRGDVDLYLVEVSVSHPEVCGSKLTKHASAAIWLWWRELPDLDGAIA